MIYNGGTVGSVVVITHGMYYLITCCLNERLDESVCLYAECGKGVMNLGICGQREKGYGIVRYLPIKSLGGKISRFFLSVVDEQLCAVCENEPFKYINKLESATVVVEDGIKKIKFQ